MELEEFQNSCNSKKCLKRQRFDEKTCIRKTKQLNCFKAYTRSEQKKVDSRQEQEEEWREQLEFDNQVWMRDGGEVKGSESRRDNWKQFCRIWNILNPQERESLNHDLEIGFNSKLEIAHIIARSEDPSKKKDLNNVVLIGAVFHRRLTDMIHPITKEPISKEEVTKWLESARDRKRYI